MTRELFTKNPGSYINSEWNGRTEAKKSTSFGGCQFANVYYAGSKSIFGDVVLSAEYLINRIPLKALDFKTTLELLQETSSYVLPPEVFGCTYFVQVHRPTLSKLDIKALNYVFLDIPPHKKAASFIIRLLGDFL